MTLDDLRALADKFFVWPEGSGRQTVTTFSALLFAQHVLQLREKSLGTENSAGMDALRNAAQRQLDALGGYRREIGLLTGVPDEQPCDAEVAARAALEQDEKPVAKIRTWHKGGEQNAELWDWDDGIETLPDGEHLLYASAPLRAALEQKAEPEPVAWRHKGAGHFTVTPLVSKFPEWEPLYTAPPQRKPLTDAEIEKLFGGAVADAPRAHWLRQAAIEVVRKTEAAHGIGEEE